jgi:hypothetical protein
MTSSFWIHRSLDVLAVDAEFLGVDHANSMHFTSRYQSSSFCCTTGAQRLFQDDVR